MLARTVISFALAALALGAARPARGQTQGIQEPLPSEVIAAAVESLNAPDVLRLSGGSRIPAGTRIEGDLAVLTGAVQIAGTVVGSVVVVNGDLELSPGARVEGDVLVVGGVVSGAEGAVVTGEVLVYAQPLLYRVRAGRIEASPGEPLSSGFLATDLGFGQARVGLRAGEAYNRVEGLPVLFGPIVQTVGSNPLSLEAFAIWRSVSGLNLDTDELGYSFRLRQAMGGRSNFYVGMTAARETVAIESQGLSDTEASLSTFLLRRDVRDYYNSRGWGAFVEIRPTRLPFDAFLSYSEEIHRTPPIRGPWALRQGDEQWRPLPLAGEGKIRSLEARLVWDSQDDPVQPSDGWWMELDIRRQIGGELSLPPSADPDPDADPPLEAASPLRFFTRGAVDLRRYARMGPTSRLVLRAAVSGNLTTGPLPPQFQSALGAEGSLPGHDRFAIDCGARSVPRVATAPGDDSPTPLTDVFAAYGCDRTVLFQAEYQRAFPFTWDPLPASWDDSGFGALFDLRPEWALFFNAGQGWSQGGLGTGIPRTDGPTRADVGFGLFVGPLRFYWAYPLNGSDPGVNFFVRLDRRF